MNPENDPETAWLFDPANAKEVKRQLDAGIASGEIIAFINRNGHITYCTTPRASQDMLANSLTLDEVHAIRASRNRGARPGASGWN